MGAEPGAAAAAALVAVTACGGGGGGGKRLRWGGQRRWRCDSGSGGCGGAAVSGRS